MKWTRDKNGLFVTNCHSCNEERRTSKRPYNTKYCRKCNPSQFGHEQIRSYTPERNKKISEAKKNWWSKQDSKKLLDNWLGDYRDKLMNHFISKPEQEYAEYLVKNNINFEHQIKINGFYFDFLLTDENKLVEIDGKYWHPTLIDENSRKWEVRNYKRDRKKDMVAINNGYELKRIRV